MISQAIESESQQILLGLEVRIERGAPDIGFIEDVLNREPVIPLLGDERDEGRIERLPGLSDTPIHGFQNAPLSSVPNRTPPDGL